LAAGAGPRRRWRSCHRCSTGQDPLGKI
jgi:hypothetical protein